VTLELLLSLTLITFADQLTKMFVARRLTQGQSRFLFGVHIQRVTNRSYDQRFSHSASVPFLLWAALFASIVLLTHYGHFFSRPAAQIGLGAALGGAGSNVHDHMRRGGIVDFIKIGWWPVFNLADVGISLGAIAALWFLR
jgi:signal peptidase II